MKQSLQILLLKFFDLSKKNQTRGVTDYMFSNTLFSTSHYDLLENLLS